MADAVPTATSSAAPNPRLGAVYAIAAYVWWGLCPIYFKAVESVPALQVLDHRVVWSLVFLAALLSMQRRWKQVWQVCRDRALLARLTLTACLIATNWGIFIWSVANDQLLQASLGYFIGPLVSVLLGLVFLREWLRPMQTLAVLLATIGVAYLTVAAGVFPWISILLACSFAIYGLIRKTAGVTSLVGLTVETAILAPIALAHLIYVDYHGARAFFRITWQLDLLLAAAGVVTAVPLLWFAVAAKNLELKTVGMLQYLAPTGQFLLAVFAYGEPFDLDRGICFVLTWIALVIYSTDAAIRARQLKRSRYAAV